MTSNTLKLYNYHMVETPKSQIDKEVSKDFLVELSGNIVLVVHSVISA